MNRRLFLLLGIAILVVTTSWLSQRQGKPDKTGIAATQLPDYFIKDFSTTVTNLHGRTSQQLTATTLYHYLDSDLTTLEQPDIKVSGEGNAAWHATADNGELSGGKQRTLLLQNNVVLRQVGDDSVTLHTKWLRIESERHYAETDAPVTIESKAGHIEGVGLNLYGDEQRLLVRSTVRGQYETE
jgi:lipopolysaccharide export system protein LptC